MKPQIREQVFNKYNNKCAYCGKEITIKQMQVDHIIPKQLYKRHVHNRNRVPYFLTHLTEFDVNHIDNLHPACAVCNNWKSCHDLELFRSELSEQINRLNNYSSNYRIAKMYGLINETVKPIIFYFETFNETTKP